MLITIAIMCVNQKPQNFFCMGISPFPIPLGIRTEPAKTNNKSKKNNKNKKIKEQQK